jgi:calcineurin-like phosphoesterase family protein
MSKIYLTSDSHFQHTNICGPKLSKWSKGYRNFDSLESMDTAIIDSYNSCVQPDDIIYHLGDVFMGQVLQNASRILGRIKCKTIHLVYGNHDKAIQKSDYLQGLFTSVQSYKEIRHKGILITCFHYPMSTWNEDGKGSLHAYAHCHGSYTHPGRAIDVGWDCFHRPISIDEFTELALAKPVNIVGHHTSTTSY